MNRKIRLIVFSSLVILYLIVSPILVVYSLGYRVDFENKRLVSTGGIYLKVWPQQSKISIGEKINRETSIFSNELLAQGLIPKTYSITVEKEGYYSWEKNLPVESQQVTRIENVTLVKKDIAFEKSKEEIASFFLSPTRSLILLQDSDQEFSLVNTRTKMEESSFSLLKTVEISLWDENAKTIILRTNEGYFSVNYGKPGKTEPEEISSNNEPKLITGSKLTFITDSGYVYLLNQQTNEFEQFYPAKDILFSPNKSRFLFFNDREILFAESKKPDQKNFLMRFSEKINKCFWLNNDYIIFDVGGQIKISEIDLRDKTNMIDMGDKISLANDEEVQLEDPEIFLDEINKKLYILNKGTLFVSEPLTDRNNK